MTDKYVEPKISAVMAHCEKEMQAARVRISEIETQPVTGPASREREALKNRIERYHACLVVCGEVIG